MRSIAVGKQTTTMASVPCTAPVTGVEKDPVACMNDLDETKRPDATEGNKLEVAKHLDPKSCLFLCFVGFSKSDEKEEQFVSKGASRGVRGGPVTKSAKTEPQKCQTVLDKLGLEEDCWALIDTDANDRINLVPRHDVLSDLRMNFPKGDAYDTLVLEPGCYVAERNVQIGRNYGLYWKASHNKYTNKKASSYVLLTYEQFLAAIKVGQSFWQTLPQAGQFWQLVHGEGTWTDPTDQTVWDLHKILPRSLTPEKILKGIMCDRFDDYELFEIRFEGMVNLAQNDSKKTLTGGRTVIQSGSKNLPSGISYAKISDLIVPNGVVLALAIQLPTADDPFVYVDEDASCPVCLDQKTHWRLNRCGCLVCTECFGNQLLRACPRCRAEKSEVGAVSWDGNTV